MQEEVPTPKAHRGGCLSQKMISRKLYDALKNEEVFFLFVPGVGRVVLQELRFSQWSSRGNSVLNSVLHGSREWSSRSNSVLNSVLHGSRE